MPLLNFDSPNINPHLSQILPHCLQYLFFILLEKPLQVAQLRLTIAQIERLMASEPSTKARHDLKKETEINESA